MNRKLVFRLFSNFALIGLVVILSVAVAVGGILESKEKYAQTDGNGINGEISDYNNPLPVIVIDAGHGGADCGAVGVNGLLEKEVNLRLSVMIKNEFENVGYTVVMTRSEDVMLIDDKTEHATKKSSDLAARVNASKAGDIFLSIHMNKFPEEKYKGAQIYYSINDARSEKLAKAVQEGIRNSLQPENTRQIKNGSGLYLLDRITVPAIIAECGFLSNSEEAEALKNEEYLKKLAFEIFSAVDEFVIAEQ